MLEAAELAFVNAWQRDFPLCRRPFGEIACASGATEEDIIDRFRKLERQAVIDRIGPVFRPNTVGASTLAAMAVPEERLQAVAGFVTSQAGVNHNYERKHRYNLWFVVTGAAAPDIRRTLARIEHDTGLPVLRLPLLEEFHIDLGFDLASGAAPRAAPPASFPALDPQERRLVAASARGLPLVREPYRAIAANAGLTEDEALALLKRMLDDGRIRRIGAVIRHRRLGYQANAMAVWNIPDERARELGQRLAGDPAITLCYRRARALPQWPYNLYCMVHGRERGRVTREVERIGARYGLGSFPRAVLFSTQCFSQRAASYG